MWIFGQLRQLETSKPHTQNRRQPKHQTSQFTKLPKKENIGAVKQHLAAGTDVNARDSIGETPLYLAARSGRKEIVELLIAKGADVNEKDDFYGTTPLHWAAVYGHKEIAELLIGEGAEVNAMDNFGRTPLHWAKRKKHKETADLLRKHGAK